MRRLLALLMAAVLGALLAGPALAATPKPMPTPAAERAAAVRGATGFAFDLYRRLAATGAPNVVLSPYSASTALSMASIGARGTTREQMARVLRHPPPPVRVHRALGTLGPALNAAGAGGEGRPLLKTANAVWLQAGYRVAAGFVAPLRSRYGAAPATLDFRGDPAGAREAINAWASENTEGLIPSLLPQGEPKSTTRLMLTNAVYLKADWAARFKAEDTRPGTFTTLAGAAIEVPMMHGLAQRRYARMPGLEAVELDYVGGRLSMLALLPEPGGLAALERRLNASALQKVLRSLTPTSVALTMPKFSFRADMDLIPPLKALGMRDAFDPDRADFRGITRAERLMIELVRQSAILKVDEKGTEAAAVTAVGIGPTSAPVVDVQLALDRPFLYLIRDRGTGTVLFLGRVGDPSQTA